MVALDPPEQEGKEASSLAEELRRPTVHNGETPFAIVS